VVGAPRGAESGGYAGGGESVMVKHGAIIRRCPRSHARGESLPVDETQGSP